MEGGGATSRTVLVVEDDVSLLQAIAKKLGLAGIDVVTARDGDQALDYLEHLEQVPCALWLDHYLPSITGSELLESVRKRPEWKDIPVFVVTNTSDQTPYQSFMDEGKVFFFLKAEAPLDTIVEELKSRASCQL